MKRLAIKTVFAVSATLLFVGCGDQIKTKEYYSAHLEEAKTKMQECQTATGVLDETQKQECDNAYGALTSNRSSGVNIYDTKGDARGFAKLGSSSEK
ncbi:MAG: EexN family lipoprotein [Sulfuricurvum sp.]|jgi:hypothetical protein